MGDQIKNMLVGLLMIAACAFTISLILFLKPSVGNGEKTYYMRFSNINGLNVGTRVMFAGSPIGEVVAVQEIGNARKQPSDTHGTVYFYQLTVRVDSSVTIYNTDEVSIQTSGLLGEKSISIIPRAPPPNVIPKPIVGKEPIYAESSDPLENAFNELSSLATSMEKTFDYLHDWLKKNGDSLSQAVTSFRSTMDEAQKAIATVNKTELILDVKHAVQNFSTSMQDIHTSLHTLQEGQFFTNANELMTHLKEAGSSVNTITKDIADGKGTLGRLIEQDDMYLRVTGLLSKANTLLNDVNQYGILFHLNKTWQRDQLQKVSLADSLESPAAFKSYFEKEVDKVNMAMARLSALMEKAEETPGKKLLLEDKSFSKEFAEFLREADALADTARLYNEELTQPQGGD